jgi:hypothetical protein
MKKKIILLLNITIIGVSLFAQDVKNPNKTIQTKMDASPPGPALL